MPNDGAAIEGLRPRAVEMLAQEAGVSLAEGERIYSATDEGVRQHYLRLACQEIANG